MAEENGNGKEIGKLIGSLQALDKGQDALFKDVSEIQAGISDVKQKAVYLDTEIKRNKDDLNGLGRKIETVKDDIQCDCAECRKEVDKKIEEKETKLEAKLGKQTTLIISVLALFLTFLTIWMYVLKSEKPTAKAEATKYQTQQPTNYGKQYDIQP